MMGMDLLDVHSVRIVSNRTKSKGTRDHTTEIYGVIRMEDTYGPFDLYNEEKGSAKSTFKDGSLTLKVPSRCFMGATFCLTMQLFEKDEHEDLDVGNGNYLVRGLTSLTFLDKHVRSAFLGKDGYSVLHYTIVRSAIEAGVKVAILTTNKRKIDDQRSGYAIYGSIIAYNDQYEYGSNYEKRYYRSTLFNAVEDEPREVPASSGKINISLSKEAVAVPVYQKLTVEANLWYKPSVTAAAQHVKGSFCFPAHPIASAAPRSTSLYNKDIEVAVEWVDHVWKLY